MTLLPLAMALTTQQERRLTRIRGEIADIEHRMKVSHNLGDSNQAQGISTQYQNLEQWQKRLDYLYAQEDALESISAGQNPRLPFNISNFIAG